MQPVSLCTAAGSGEIAFISVTLHCGGAIDVWLFLAAFSEKIVPAKFDAKIKYILQKFLKRNKKTKGKE